MSSVKWPESDSDAFQPDLRVGVYGLAMLLSFAWLMMSFADRPLLTFVAIVAGVMTFFFRAWFIGFIYFLSLGFLFVTEPSATNRTVNSLFLSEYIYVFSVMTFLISANRFVVLTAPVLSYGSLTISDGLKETIEFVMSSLKGSSPGPFTNKALKNARLESRDKSTIRPEEFLSAAARVLVSILIAAVVLSFVSLNPTSRVEYGLTMTGFRTASLAWCMVGIVLLLGLVFTPISWLRHSPLQAGVYLRTQLTQWSFADLRRMVRNLVKDRQRSTVRRLGRGDVDRVSVMDEDGSVVRADEVPAREVK